MSVISWMGPFFGEVPRVRPHLLPDGASQFAQDVVFENGALTPRRDSSTVATPSKAGTKKTIYRFGKDLASDTQYWFHWLNDTDVARGHVPDDASERTYFTESGQAPKVTDSSIALASTAYPHASYLLGLPQPAACSAAISGTPSGTTPAVQLVVTYTYVTAWGEEGPPALAPSNAVDWQPGQILTVSGMAVAPSGAYNVVSKRIYVAVVASDGSQRFQLWTTAGDVPAAQTSYAAVFDSSALRDSLEEPYLVAPRTDLFGLMAHPGQFMVGFSGKRVCRSEVNRPHGWPDEYEDPVAHDIVGGAIIGTTLVVCSKVWTYRFHGGDPLNMQPELLEGFYQPCVAKRSITVSDQVGVLYASPDGVVAIPPSGRPEVISQKIITPKQWRAFNPASMMAVWHDGHYIVFYDNGTQGALIFNFADATVTRSSLYATAAYVDPRENSLFLQVGNDIKKWEASGTNRAMTFRSKEIVRAHLDPCRCAKVVAEAYPVTFEFWTKTGDAAFVQRHVQAVTSSQAFSLPTDYGARKVYWQVSGSLGEVREVHLADAISELEAIG